MLSHSYDSAPSSFYFVLFVFAQYFMLWFTYVEHVDIYIFLLLDSNVYLCQYLFTPNR